MVLDQTDKEIRSRCQGLAIQLTTDHSEQNTGPAWTDSELQLGRRLVSLELTKNCARLNTTLKTTMYHARADDGDELTTEYAWTGGGSKLEP
jgi:hypothetical protein